MAFAYLCAVDVVFGCACAAYTSGYNTADFGQVASGTAGGTASLEWELCVREFCVGGFGAEERKKGRGEGGRHGGDRRACE